MCLRPQDLFCLGLESVKYSLHQFLLISNLPLRMSSSELSGEHSMKLSDDLIVGVTSDQEAGEDCCSGGLGQEPGDN